MPHMRPENALNLSTLKPVTLVPLSTFGSMPYMADQSVESLDGQRHGDPKSD